MSTTQTYSAKSAAVKAAKVRADRGEFSLADVSIEPTEDGRFRIVVVSAEADEVPAKELDAEQEGEAVQQQDEISDEEVERRVENADTGDTVEGGDRPLDERDAEPQEAQQEAEAQPQAEAQQEPEAQQETQQQEPDAEPQQERAIPDEDFNVTLSFSCTPTQAREMAELLSKKLDALVKVGFGGDWPPGYSVDPSEKRQRRSTGGGRREKAGPEDGARGLPAGKSGELYALAQRDGGVLRTDLTAHNGGRCINWKGFLEALAQRRGHTVTVDKPGDGTVVYRVRDPKAQAVQQAA